MTLPAAQTSQIQTLDSSLGILLDQLSVAKGPRRKELLMRNNKVQEVFALSRLSPVVTTEERDERLKKIGLIAEGYCCAHPDCLKADKLFQRCSQCKFVKYCSKEHQIEDRERHKSICEEIAPKKVKIETKESKLESKSSVQTPEISSD